jgi:hypothetical protein
MTVELTRNPARPDMPAGRAALTAMLAVATTTPVLAQETIEEIVVTAQRRETSLQTTPVAITAVHRRDARREQGLHGQRPRGQRARVLADRRHAARRRAQRPRHHQHASRLALGRSVGRHLRRRCLHGPHRRPQLRLLRSRARRGDPRPAGRAARQERGRWRAQRHHRQPSFENSRRRCSAPTATTTRRCSPATSTAASTTASRGAFSFPVRNHDGYAKRRAAQPRRRGPRILPGARPAAVRAGRLRLVGRGSRSTTTRTTNGINVVAVDGGTRSCETSYLRTNCTRPWSNLRAFSASPTRAERGAERPVRATPTPTQQFMRARWLRNAVLDIEREGSFVHVQLADGLPRRPARSSTTRPVRAPRRSNWSIARWQQYIAFVNSRYSADPPGHLQQRPVPLRAAGRRGVCGHQAVQPGVPPHLERQGQRASTGSRAPTTSPISIDKSTASSARTSSAPCSPAATTHSRR